jgi:glutathione S-transferase
MEFVSVEEAKRRRGLRLVVVPGFPSPWGEAAKGIFHMKKIPFAAVRLDTRDRALVEWIGEESAPVAMYEDEAPRGGWAEILLLAERLAPQPPLVPRDPAQRAELFGLAHEICGEMGLGWCRRLAAIAAGLEGRGGFPRPLAEYLGRKYGWRPGIEAEAQQRVCDVLELLAARLRAQRELGSGYYLGNQPSALDVYSAAFMALFRLLPPQHCPLPDTLRTAFEMMDDATREALDPILLEHRDRIYRDHLVLPLSF